MRDKKGIVYLVGAGPGDPGLITVRGLDCLRRADVVVYDNLANPALLAHTRPGAELIYAGKKAENHTKTQDEINTILAERAAAGQTVVRLKGGDPFLFGRGGEEAAWLTDHQVQWEIVPGVTSALAVPAYAGIPVTHRMVNGSLHVVTGHEGESADGVELDWSVLARSQGTIVILMGVKNLPAISEKLIAHGLSPATPVAMIRWGTMAEQQTLISRLDRAAEDVAAAGIKPPAVCVVGEVVALREKLAWVEKRPLFGLRIAVTRPLDENRVLSQALEDLGAELALTPTLKLQPVTADETALQTCRRLAEGEYDWLCLTSSHGVQQFLRLLMETGHDVRVLSRCRIAVIGDRTAASLRDHGLFPDLVAKDATQEGLATELIAVKPRQVLVARAKIARGDLEQRLTASGATVEILPVYETVPDLDSIGRLRQMLERRRLHGITFTSARTFQALADAAGEDIPALLKDVAVAVIGPITRAAVEKAGLHVSVEASQPDMAALAKALVRWRQGRDH